MLFIIFWLAYCVMYIKLNRRNFKASSLITPLIFINFLRGLDVGLNHISNQIDGIYDGLGLLSDFSYFISRMFYDDRWHIFLTESAEYSAIMYFNFALIILFMVLKIFDEKISELIQNLYAKRNSHEVKNNCGNERDNLS